MDTGGEMANVTREHRQQAWLRFGGVLRIGTGHAQYEWLETGALPPPGTSKIELLDDIAQAIASAEADGRAKERLSVVAWMRRRGGQHTNGGSQAAWNHVRDSIADQVVSGAHVISTQRVTKEE
jgi:hypothetical protein